MTYSGASLKNRDSAAELPSLSELWAKKYVAKLKEQDNRHQGLSSAQFRADAAQALTELLRPISAKAWHTTESLLSQEIHRHQINPELIDPWAIAKDVHQVYEKSLSAYANHVSPQRFSVAISSDIGKIRQKHTAHDPRVIGFVSMQFHYCGQILAAQVEGAEKETLAAYFKVIDDHLYMPLQRAYEAAANYNYEDPQLKTVHHLLPHSSKIAIEIVDTVHQRYPNCATHTGLLSSRAVRISSIRDVEMFQVYLLTCVLEQNISAIKQELFPLCVMLYPTLNVDWELVREMLSLLQQAFSTYGQPQDAAYYQPYSESLWKMFSSGVLG
ncbi:MAG: hypothetical protein F6J95_028125 [Leptolyngbya sp. SIO1E4]|nr:hypothetical protein [Leptolyngbya sp. SIO1E4]